MRTYSTSHSPSQLNPVTLTTQNPTLTLDVCIEYVPSKHPDVVIMWLGQEVTSVKWLLNKLLNIIGNHKNNLEECPPHKHRCLLIFITLQRYSRWCAHTQTLISAPSPTWNWTPSSPPCLGDDSGRWCPFRCAEVQGLSVAALRGAVDRRDGADRCFASSPCTYSHSQSKHLGPSCFLVV